LSIDVYSIGRRWQGIHGALVRSAAAGHIFYVYDTFPAMANMEPYDVRGHRDLFAAVLKRSHHFVVSPAKMNLSEETQGQVEIGYRYFEGVVAGTVMIGQEPDCEAFKEAFPWSDVVVQIQPDGSDVLTALATLKADPERVTRIRRRNAVEGLLRHDWIYRWKKILSVVGLEPPEGFMARENRLRRLADLAMSVDETVPSC
jgi:hypothetical protein